MIRRQTRMDLRIMRRAMGALTTLCLSMASFGQTPAPPAFEAATIKPSAANDSGTDRDSSPGFLSMQNFTLRGLIRVAYEVKEFQVIGGPKWIDSDRYDITAKAAGPAKDPELLLMLRTLLSERFQLKMHPQSKPFPGYALVAVKGGLRIKPVEGAAQRSESHGRSLVVTGTSMARLAEWFARRLNAPVIDATGAAGAFSFKLEWVPETSAASRQDNDPDPALLYAFQDQLGIQLQPRKVPLEIFVVDSAEKPSAN